MALHSLESHIREFAQGRLDAGQETPFLVVDLNEGIDAYTQFRTKLPRVRPHYAVKANPDRPLVEVLRDMGSCFDVASIGEIQMLVTPPDKVVEVFNQRGLGVDPKRLIFANPVKRLDNIVEALQLGVRLFTADCREELDKISEASGLAKLDKSDRPGVLARIWVPNFGSMIDLSSKFGAENDETMSMFAHAAGQSLHLHLRGLAFHVGSQCVNPTNYTKATGMAMELMRQLEQAGHRIDMVDIGGGFPVNYTLEVSYVDDVLDAVAASINKIPKHIDVIAEPGRAFCATVATLFTTIVGRTVRHGKTWYFIDDSIYHTFSGKIYDLMDYQFYPLNRAAVPGAEVVVAGCSCDGHDIISKHSLLPPDLPVGSILYAPNIGAYTSASASYFNGFRPADRLFIEPNAAVPALGPA
ncbi:MAG: type III PLP-dependent enzyme [Planctomycetota bacterium]